MSSGSDTTKDEMPQNYEGFWESFTPAANAPETHRLPMHMPGSHNIQKFFFFLLPRTHVDLPWQCGMHDHAYLASKSEYLKY